MLIDRGLADGVVAQTEMPSLDMIEHVAQDLKADDKEGAEAVLDGLIDKVFRPHRSHS